MDFDDIANALADAARTVTHVPAEGVAAVPIQAHGFGLESLGTLPAFEVGEVEIAYDQSFGGANSLSEAVFTCRVYASRADDRSGHARLKKLLARTGAGSIKTALELDKTLGGLVEALHVKRVRGYGRYDVAGTDYYGARFDVHVWGRG